MNENILEINGLYKKFCRELSLSLSYGIKDLAKQFIKSNDNLKLREGEFYALEDINLILKKGDCLSILGPNGASKTTLLRTILGILKADQGEIRYKGKMLGLLELGASFCPDLNATENIEILGLLLGFDNYEIKQRTPEILNFAELTDYAHAPLFTYSSGMQSRLGFSIAFSFLPEILLIDEAIVVGDPYFREKCHKKLIESLDKGLSVIFASNSPSTVQRLSTRSILMDKGKICFDGSTHQCLLYMDKINKLNISKNNSTSNSPWLEMMEVEDLNSEKINNIEIDGSFNIITTIKSDIEINDASLYLAFSSPTKGYLIGAHSLYKNFSFKINKGETKINFLLHEICLLEGSYQINAMLLVGDKICSRLTPGAFIEVEHQQNLNEWNKKLIGAIKAKHEWKLV